jgi:hypothetical protein
MNQEEADATEGQVDIEAPPPGRILNQQTSNKRSKDAP